MGRRHIHVVGAMIENNGGRYLITQRPRTASLPLLWEFPGGRVQPGETDQQALARELREEMGIQVEVKEEAIHLHHEYPQYDIDFRVFSCRLLSPESAISHLRVIVHRWVTIDEMRQYRIPDVTARMIVLWLNIIT